MATVDWDGVSSPAADNEWSETSGWSSGTLPGASDSIVVMASSPTLLLSSVNSGGPTTTTNVSIASAEVQSGASWIIQAYSHTVTITNNLEIDGGMSITDPFDQSSPTIDIGGTLIVTNSGAGLGIGNYLQGAVSEEPGNATTVTVDASSVTDNSGTNNGTITIDSDQADGSVAKLVVTSAAGFDGQTGDLIGDVNIGTDGLHSGGEGLLEFLGGGEITTIQGSNGTYGAADLSLYGSKSYVADSTNTSSNSALTGLTEIDGELNLQDGVNVSPTGSVTIGSNGNVAVDTGFEGIAGSVFAVADTLTVDGHLTIGRSAMTGNALVTANALSSTGTISLDGADASDKGELEVAAAAGFGTAGTLSGNVIMQDFSLLRFASGGITTIAQGADLQFSGGDTFIAIVGSTTSNSALTGLTTINGDLSMQGTASEGGVSIAPTGSVTIGSNGAVDVDGGFLGNAGSLLAVTDTLTVNGSLSVGRSAMIGIGEVTAGTLAGTGSISIDGDDAGNIGEIIVSGAAGMGSMGVIAGNLLLQDDSLLQFGSGSINTIDFGGSVEITSADAFVADNGSTSSNSALNGISTIAGSLTLTNGASVTGSSGGVTLGDGTHGASISIANGASFSTTGTLNLLANNNSVVDIGGRFDTVSTTLTVGALINPDGVNIDGDPGASTTANLKINGALSGDGTIFINDGGLEIGTTASGGGSITFQSGGGTLKLDSATLLGETLSGLNANSTVDFASLTYNSSYFVALAPSTQTGGTLSIENSANDSVVASFSYLGDYRPSDFTAAADAGGTSVVLTGSAAKTVPISDFIGDGVSDILYRNNTTGDTGFYQINSGANTGWHDVGASSTAYSIVGTGDFYGTGTTDILYRNAVTGDTGFYRIGNGANTGWHDVGASSTAYSVVGVGDFTGNDIDDILYRNNTTGDTGFYQIVNGANTGWHDIGASSTAYSVVGVGDFTGGGNDDILYRNNTTGDTGFYEIVNGVNSGWHDIGASSTAYSVVGVGDFTGSDTDDILYRNNTNGDTGFYEMVNGVNTGWHDIGASSTAYSVVATGDYLGTETADVLFRNSTTGDTGFYALSNGVNIGWHDVGASSTAYHVTS